MIENRHINDFNYADKIIDELLEKVFLAKKSNNISDFFYTIDTLLQNLIIFNSTLKSVALKIEFNVEDAVVEKQMEGFTRGIAECVMAGIDIALDQHKKMKEENQSSICVELGNCVVVFQEGSAPSLLNIRKEETKND